MSEDGRGQSALFDAVIFLIIMLGASGLVLAYNSHIARDMELADNESMMDYCRNTAASVLGATLNSSWYEDINGDIVTRPPGDTTVLTLILDELYLLDDDLPREHFEMGYERHIRILARNLIISSYHFSLLAAYNGPDPGGECNLLISDIMPEPCSGEEGDLVTAAGVPPIPRDNLASVQMTFPMVGKPGDVTITLSLWV